LVIARAVLDVCEEGDPPSRVRHEHRLAIEFPELRPDGWMAVGLKSLGATVNPEPYLARRPLATLVPGRAAFDPEVELQKAACLAEEGLLEAAAAMEGFALTALAARAAAWTSEDAGRMAQSFHPRLVEAEADRIRQARERRGGRQVEEGEELEGIDLVRLEPAPPRPGFTLRLVVRGRPRAGTPRGPLYCEYWTLSRPGGWQVELIEAPDDYLA
jgi:hypothetical protein